MDRGRAESLSRRVGSALRRKLAQRLGLVSSQHFYLDSPIMQPRTGVDRIGLYSQSVDMRIQMPANGWTSTCSYAPRYVYRLANPTVDPISNLIYDHEGRFIAESSSETPLRRLYDWPRPYSRSRQRPAKGEFVFLPSNSSMYHWLEDLAVFASSLNFSPDAVVLVARSATRHDDAWFRRRQEVIDGLVDRQVVYIDRLTSVQYLCLTAKTGGIGSPAGLQTLHPTDVDTVRQFFGPWLADAEPSGKYYLSRRGFSRSPRDEVALEAVAESSGYQVLQLADLSLRGQVELFSGAEAVAGLHGAALANTIWMQSGTRIVEFFQDSYVPAHYAALASSRNLRHNFAIYHSTGNNCMGPDFLKSAEFLLAE